MQVRGELEPPAEEEPGFGVASEASAPLLSISDSALMGRAAAFLQVTWMPAVEPRQSVFRMQAMAPRPQKFPAFPDFMEELTETHLMQMYAAEAQATRLSNMASLLTAYTDSVLREASLPEPVATELRLLSSTLLQISSLQGQALGRSLASLIVACGQAGPLKAGGLRPTFCHKSCSTGTLAPRTPGCLPPYKAVTCFSYA
ncbi:UNVERIFIED_CONTAM: hypothetical protein FKN15_075463 [Acipenser sinensis]